MVYVNFESILTAINSTKNRKGNIPKINITPYGEIFISLLTEIKFKIWRVTFLKSFFTTEKLLDGLPVFRKKNVQMHLR